MSHYTAASFRIAPLEPWRGIMTALLGEIGYDTFEDNADGLVAYIPTERFDAAAVDALFPLSQPDVIITWKHHGIEPRNWNAEWESSFSPIEIRHDASTGQRTGVRIRAEFHPSVPGFTHELVVTPRMAFGTGHHATTRMMVRAMLGLDFHAKTVCDLGCGTAVLAILAERLGAARVDAFDIDPGAVDNAREVVARNGCERVRVDNGTAAALKGLRYAAILANIERNTLLRDLPALREALGPGGILLLSGFVVADVPRMREALVEQGLQPVEELTEGEWALVGGRKP
ncbi:MAG: 50S ribosomal protein L11 methyltransferase [Flavobacteriales bacterium]|nr:MAG: 50S ribosomal protein L11 methyltransferase [Flavobacteriales bacterium]